MKLSERGLDLLKRSEGFRAQTYVDAAGFATIGYGHKLRANESFPNGIDLVLASGVLDADVQFAERCVAQLVHVDLTQGQFDALVDFTFNMGGAALASSTLLKDLNAGLYETAAHQLLSWDHVHVNGNLVELHGLKVRREAEYELWHLAA